jgi:hypothetical protein
VSTLFRGYNKLILGFNTFLPDGYKIELSDIEEMNRAHAAKLAAESARRTLPGGPQGQPGGSSMAGGAQSSGGGGGSSSGGNRDIMISTAGGYPGSTGGGFKRASPPPQQQQHMQQQQQQRQQQGGPQGGHLRPPIAGDHGSGPGGYHHGPVPASRGGSRLDAAPMGSRITDASRIMPPGDGSGGPLRAPGMQGGAMMMGMAPIQGGAGGRASPQGGLGPVVSHTSDVCICCVFAVC